MKISWNDFANSLNHAFSNENIFTIQNISLLILILLISVIIIIIIRYDAIKQDIERHIAYQETQKEILRKKQLNKNSNKRAWYRMDTELPFKWYPLPIPSHIKPKNFYDGIAIDISGGGLLFYTEEISNLNEEIKLLLPLDNITLDLTAQIVRAQAEEKEGMACYLAGVKFTKIREGERDKIISWIMKSQAEDLVNQKITAIQKKDIEIDNSDDIEIPLTYILDEKITKTLINDYNNEVNILIPTSEDELLSLKGHIINSLEDEEDSLIINIKTNLKQASLIKKSD